MSSRPISSPCVPRWTLRRWSGPSRARRAISSRLSTRMASCLAWCFSTRYATSCSALTCTNVCSSTSSCRFLRPASRWDRAWRRLWRILTRQEPGTCLWSMSRANMWALCRNPKSSTHTVACCVTTPKTDLTHRRVSIRHQT